MSFGQLARAAFGGALFGVTAFASANLANDLITYRKLQARAMELASNDKELVDVLGEPLTPGPWYNGTIRFSHHNRVASCGFEVKGK